MTSATSSVRKLIAAAALVLTMAAVVGETAPAHAGDAERGEEKIRSGDHAGAAESFRAVLAASPQDRDARYGLARALAFSGDFAGGEREYRTILSGNPEDDEARLGLSDVLAWQKKYPEAEELLSTAARKRPDDVEVLLRQGKVALWSGDLPRARERFGRAQSLSLGNPEAVRGLEAVRASEVSSLRREAEAGLSLLRIRDGSPGTQVWAALRDGTVRPYEFFGRVDYLHRFGEDEGRGTVGVLRKREKGMSLRGEAAFSPGAEVFARFVGEGEAGWPVNDRIAAGVGGKYAKYAHAETWNANVSLECYLPRKDTPVFLRYGLYRTRFDSGGKSTDSAWLVKVTHFFDEEDRVWAYYSRGTEGYDASTSDRIGDLSNDTFGAGGRTYWGPSWGAEGNVEWQEREGGGRYLTFTAVARRRF